MITYKIVMGLTLFLTALITGLFYSWTVSAGPGLHRLNDASYLQSMQHVNRAILNPAFFASFMGTVIMLPVCTFVVYRQGSTVAFWLTLAAALLYIIGTFGVTVVRNVPLNNMLDQFEIPGAGAEELRSLRMKFEAPWNRWNVVRTVAGMASLGCAIAAALVR
jgi:Predicted integral membrane protein